MFRFKRGDTIAIDFEYNEKDTGLPIDLSDCSARLSIRNKNTKVIAINTSTVTTGLSILNNVVTLNIPGTLPVGNFEFDLEITYPNGTVESTDTILLTIIEDITL